MPALAGQCGERMGDPVNALIKFGQRKSAGKYIAETKREPVRPGDAIVHSDQHHGGAFSPSVHPHRRSNIS